jgi:WD40 repeat protein
VDGTAPVERPLRVERAVPVERAVRVERAVPAWMPAGTLIRPFSILRFAVAAAIICVAIQGLWLRDGVAGTSAGPRSAFVPGVSAAKPRADQEWYLRPDYRRRLLLQQQPVAGVTFAADGRTLATSDSDGRIRFRNSTSGKIKHTVPGTRVAFSPDRRFVAVAGQDGTVRILDAATFRTRRVFRYLAGDLSALTFSPDGRTLAFRGSGGVTLLSSVTRDGSLRAIPTEGTGALAFSADGRRLITSGALRSMLDVSAVRLGDAIRIQSWDVDTGNLQHSESIPMLGSPQNVVFSPDGRILASGVGASRAVDVRDVATGKLLGVLDGAGRVDQVVFSTDGRTVAFSDVNRVVLWDLRILMPRRTVPLEGDRTPTGLAFSPDGSSLAIVKADATVQFWPVP